MLLNADSHQNYHTVQTVYIFFTKQLATGFSQACQAFESLVTSL